LVELLLGKVVAVAIGRGVDDDLKPLATGWRSGAFGEVCRAILRADVD